MRSLIKFFKELFRLFPSEKRFYQIKPTEHKSDELIRVLREEYITLDTGTYIVTILLMRIEERLKKLEEK